MSIESDPFNVSKQSVTRGLILASGKSPVSGVPKAPKTAKTEPEPPKPEERVQATYRGNYQRLTKLKQKYDAGNVFRGGKFSDAT